MSLHRSLNQDYKHREESDRRRNYALTPKRGSRYERQGALSPLRSPLREQREKRHSEGKRFTNSRHRSGEESQTLFPRKTYDDNAIAPWQTVDKPHLSPFENDEFPTLDHIRYTPESGLSRMSCLSKPSDWASQVEQYELQQSMTPRDHHRFKRKLSLTDSDASDSKERDDKVSQEIEEDKGVLKRRQKQIDLGRHLGAYRQYLRAVPRNLRTSQHPHTPKKFRKFSRRSWDMQIRIWKRQLHLWGQNGGVSVPDDASSTASAGPDDASSNASTSEGDSQGHPASITSDTQLWDVENVMWHIPSDELIHDLKSVVLDTGHTMAPLEADETAVVIDCDVGDDATLNW